MSTRKTHPWAVLAIAASLLTATSLAIADETESTEPSLYERLGGLAPISVVVDELLHALVSDELLNANPAIDEARKRVPLPYLSYHVTTLVCQTTGGPCQYSGRGMKESHAHLNITAKEWDRMVEHLTGILAKHGVPEKETQELLTIVDSTKADIVAARAD